MVSDVHPVSFPTRVLHLLNLDTVGGVEQLFFHLITGCAVEPGQEDHCLVTGGRVHAHFADLNRRLASLAYAKSWMGLKLPRRPHGLRAWHVRNVLRRVQPGVAVLWNRFGDESSVASLHAAGCPVIHYEHGAAWLAPHSEARQQFLARVQSVVCISRAAQRVLQLRWGYAGRSHVVPNALRPDLAATEARPKTLPRDRPTRLGIAARLIPLKGIGVALHALRELRRRGCKVELQVAGTGPLLPFLEAEARQLGVTEVVTFLGVVRDMAAFFDNVDLLLVPAVREPFGLVIIEAAARGCPSICGQVDGMPEAVRPNRTGICLTPTLELDRAPEFGGTQADFPPLVYDPEGDRLVPPRFLDPQALAAAVEGLIATPERYTAMSASAIEHARGDFSMQAYAHRLRDVFAATLAGG